VADTQDSTSVLLVDLSSLVWPLFHVTIDDPDPNAASVKALARIRAMVPEGALCAICTDTGRSFRKDLDKSYKANRADKDARVTHQLTLAAEKLRADGYTVLGASGFEADDIIATATAQLVAQGCFVRVLSSDKDLMQLICASVHQQSLNDGKVYDEPAVFAKFGVGPEQMRDYLTLVGDKSDNITGVKSIGPERAADILRKFVRLDALLEKMQEHGAIPQSLGLSPSTFKAIAESGAAIATARELITLRTDAPITVAAAHLARTQPERTEPMIDDIDEAMPTLAPEKPHEPVAAPPTGGQVGAALATRADVAAQDVLAPAPEDWNKQLEPRSLRESAKMAELMFKSRLFSAYGTPEAVLSTILAGREFGLSTMAALRSMHVIDGRPTMAADLIRALVIRSGAVKFFRCTERSDKACTFEAQRGDDPTIRLTFTIEEARRAWSKDQAAWDKSGWGKNPADLLVARAGAKLARLVAPDVIHGIYAPEEFDNAV